MTSFRNNYIYSNLFAYGKKKGMLKPEAEKGIKDYNVIIADRDLRQAKHLKSFLSKKGYGPLLVDRGGFLLKEINRRKICLLFLDVKLLDISKGYTLIPIIKKIRPNIQIVITSNSNSFETESQIRRHSILFYLIKPYDLSEIELLVRDTLMPCASAIL